MSLITVTLEVNSAEQADLLRCYHGLLMELEQLAQSAPEGQILDVCEAAVLKGGREVNRETLRQVVQQRIDALEKKGRPCGRVAVVGRGKTAAQANAKS